MTQHSHLANLTAELRAAGFRGQIEDDKALRAAMATDNSIYRILPDLVLAPMDATDVSTLLRVLDQPAWADMPITARGGGTGTNGQSLNRGLILDLRRHMTRLLEVNAEEGWAEVEPGMVLDDLNARLRPLGLFFAPETSTSSRCTIGGMVSTDASGKGSRVYGKTSDNILALELAFAEGLLHSAQPMPDWAAPMLAQAEAAARAGRAAFIARTPRLNRRFTGYDLERACPPDAPFEWWRLMLGAEGTLGVLTRIRVKLRRIEAEKRLLVVGFDSFRNAVAAATPLLAADPTAIEVMDETVQGIAAKAGILSGLPPALHAREGQSLAYAFIEFNGDDPALLAARVQDCRALLARLPGALTQHEAADLAEIKALWAIRSAGVGLLAKVDGPARPMAFVEDCVVPPENLPAFIDGFLAILSEQGLGFGIYGHVDVGCLHIRPALNLDTEADRGKLIAVSDAVFALTEAHGGVFWGEHGKGLRGAYLRDWIGPEAYGALQAVKAAFDPKGRFNPGKLVAHHAPVMGLATTPFRSFNAPEGDPLQRAFRCNGNAQCLSYAATTPMCPSFKATADLRHSPKGRADALRDWHRLRCTPEGDALEADLYQALDGCLGCKACATACPVQVDIPTLRGLFLENYHQRHARPLADRLTLLTERFSPLALRLAPLLGPVWPVLARAGQALTSTVDLPKALAGRPPKDLILRDFKTPLPAGTVLLAQDWFTALFDGEVLADVVAGLRALGYQPRLLPMRPAGKAAQSLGATAAFQKMGADLVALLNTAAALGAPILGLDPAFVMQLRQDYPKAGLTPPKVLLPQEFLAEELLRGAVWPQALHPAPLRLLGHCTETTGRPGATELWAQVFAAVGIKAETPATGCCGMAGLFGHQARHQAVSQKLFDLSWRKLTEDTTPSAATGFSCRCQIERLSRKSPRHPLGLLAEALK